jgi:hypothetical protein
MARTSTLYILPSISSILYYGCQYCSPVDVNRITVSPLTSPALQPSALLFCPLPAYPFPILFSPAPPLLCSHLLLSPLTSPLFPPISDGSQVLNGRFKDLLRRHGEAKGTEEMQITSYCLQWLEAKGRPMQAIEIGKIAPRQLSAFLEVRAVQCNVM